MLVSTSEPVEAFRAKSACQRTLDTPRKLSRACDQARAWLKCEVSFFLAFLARSFASRAAAAAAALLAPFFAAAAAFFRASAFFACFMQDCLYPRLQGSSNMDWINF